MIKIEIKGLSKLSKVINKATNDALLTYAKKVHKKLSDARKEVRTYMESFLQTKAPSRNLPYPNTITGNLLKNLIRIKMNKNANQLKVQNNTVSFKIISELDGGGNGSTVVSKDSRKVPYARFLNAGYKNSITGKYVNGYKNFFDKLQQHFKDEYSDRISKL